MKKLKDRIQFNSPVVIGFALLSFVSLILGYITDMSSTKLLFCTYSSPLSDPLTYIRAFGHVLGHANLQHYINNMMYILLLGPILEEKYGSKRLLIMIMLTAVISSVIINLFFNGAVLGASGIVFMFIILSSMVKVDEGKIPLTFIIVAVLYIGQEVVNGLFISDNVSQLGHIIGGVCGGVFGKLSEKRTDSF